MFVQNPAKYVPALGGDCVVCLDQMGDLIPGNVRYAAFYKGRLFMFPSEEQKEMFRQNPAAFETADLAYDGNCAVCLVDMNEQVPGSAEIATFFRGKRYLFPSEEQREMFLANPVKYAEPAQRR